jgi:hypothetical protein
MHPTQCLIVFLLSLVKTLFAPPVAFAFALTFQEVLFSVAIGGVLGFTFFFFLSDYFLRQNKKKNLRIGRKNSFHKARRLIYMKRKYKLFVFLFFLPFFSIPVMAYVVRRFYGHSLKIFAVSIFIIVFWSVASTIFFSPMGMF